MKITEIRVHLGIGKGVFTGTQLLPFMDLGKRVFGNWDREFPRCEVMTPVSISRFDSVPD